MKPRRREPTNEGDSKQRPRPHEQRDQGFNFRHGATGGAARGCGSQHGAELEEPVARGFQLRQDLAAFSRPEGDGGDGAVEAVGDETLCSRGWRWQRAGESGVVSVRLGAGYPFTGVVAVGYPVASRDVEPTANLGVLLDETVQAHPVESRVVEVGDVSGIGGVLIEDGEAAVAPVGGREIPDRGDRWLLPPDQRQRLRVFHRVEATCAGACKRSQEW